MEGEGRRSKAGVRVGLDFSAILSSVSGIFNSLNFSEATFSQCNWWKPLVKVPVSRDKVIYSLVVRHSHCALPKCGWRECG